MWLKNASKDIFFASVLPIVSFAMGTRISLNFASLTFLSITFFDPFASRTFSSLGRLNASVCMPALASPAE